MKTKQIEAAVHSAVHDVPTSVRRRGPENPYVPWPEYKPHNINLAKKTCVCLSQARLRCVKTLAGMTGVCAAVLTCNASAVIDQFCDKTARHNIGTK